MVKLYSEYFERSYYTKKISCTHLFFIGIVISVILMPALISFSTNNFWRPATEYYGRPNIKFTDEAIISAAFSSSTGTITKSYSNVQMINQQIRDRIDGPLFKSLTIDDDNNRVVDEFKFEFSFKAGGATIKSISILLHFTYYIENTVMTQFKGVVPIYITSSAAGITDAYVTGKLGLNQQNPLDIGSGISNTLYNYNFTIEASKYGINDIFERYTNRNKTIDYDYKTTIRAYGDSDTTTVTIRMSVPNYDLVIYYPSYLESIKLAWIQYLPILAIVYLLLYLCLFGYGVKSSAFSTVRINNMPKDETKTWLVNE